MELSFELTPDDYSPVRRLTRSFPWAQVIAAAVVLPSLLALYLGGFRVALGVIAAVLALLLLAGFRAAAKLKRRAFVQNRCTPQLLTTSDEFLEIDGVIEWRRIDWSYVDGVRQQDGWVVIELFEGDPLLIPPRALSDDQRRQLVDQATAATAEAQPRESSEFSAWRELEEERASASYTIDNDYMRSLVELRFHDRVGWRRMFIVAVLTVIGCKFWPDVARQVAGAGAAIALPMVVMRVMEQLLKRRALRRAEIDFEIPMTLSLHEDGYERRCRLFQSFTSWLLVNRMQVARPFVLISHSDHEHLLVPVTAWSDGEETAFCELGNRLRAERLAEEHEQEERPEEAPVAAAPEGAPEEDPNKAGPGEDGAGEEEPVD